MIKVPDERGPRFHCIAEITVCIAIGHILCIVILSSLLAESMYFIEGNFRGIQFFKVFSG